MGTDDVERREIAVARPDSRPPRPRRPARRWALLLACLLPALPARAQIAASEAQAVFAPLWDELPQQAGWQLQVSPPLPGAWPQPAGGTVERYALALRLTPNIADGAEVAAPWAKSTVDATGRVGVERLSPRLRPLGVQGVRPLRSEEIVLIDREQEVARLLLAGGAAATNGLVRDFTCGWIGRQGVAAAAIMPLHPGFTRWLACP